MFKLSKSLWLFGAFITIISFQINASHISGIRLTQTGNTGLMIDVDVTAFYTTGSTEATANLGTYYNQVPAIDWGDGSTVPRYGYGPSTGIPVVATSTVVNGIPARAYRGSFSHTYGATGDYTIRANTSCCALTTPTYTLVTGEILTTTVTTTGPFGPTTFTTSFIQNTLAVGSEAPGFTKVFAPDTVAVGVPSTLTFTIDNSASTLDDADLDFTDNLPAGLMVATPANVINTCTGGTVTATSGTGAITYTGGVVSAGATCSISVDTVSSLPGGYVNTSGDLTSAFGNSGTANDTLTVTAVIPDFAKTFAPDTIGVGAVSTLTFTLDNTANMAEASAVDFTDLLPVGLVIATPANVTNTCTGGTLTATSGASVISYTGGAINASSTCSIGVDTRANSPGVLVNNSGDLTSTFGNSGIATDSLTVSATILGFAKNFAPDMVAVNAVSTLTFTIENSNLATAVDLDFTDNLPANMLVATPANASTTCAVGTLTAVDGTSVISYSGGEITGGTNCTVNVDVIGTTGGILNNVSGDLTSNFGNSGSASATLTTAGAPLFTKAFSPDNLVDVFMSTLTFTIDNSANGIDATALSFVDNMPSGMVVSDTPNIVNNCIGGVITAVSGAGDITYTGGTVMAGSVCTLSVDVNVTGDGDFNNVAGPLSSSLGTSDAASASDSLMVTITRIIPSLSIIGLVVMIIAFMVSYQRRRKQEV